MVIKIIDPFDIRANEAKIKRQFQKRWLTNSHPDCLLVGEVTSRSAR
jgi:hypothetical protein